MKTLLKTNAVHWALMMLASGLLLWGWSVAVKNLINGTTVVS